MTELFSLGDNSIAGEHRDISIAIPIWSQMEFLLMVHFSISCIMNSAAQRKVYSYKVSFDLIS